MTERIAALFRAEDRGLLSPRLGIFHPTVADGAWICEGTVLGQVEVLHRRWPVVAPPGVTGLATGCFPGPRVAVQYGSPLLHLGTAHTELVASATPAPSPGEGTMVGELLKAPIHGIFYRRPTPAEAAYIEVGASLTRGQVVGLVEVMKSFHPVVWQGQDGRVVAILVVDLAEVAHGQPLLRVAVGGVE